jgi:hypothetical protein
VNLKIKSAQSFRCAHRGRVCVCVHRGECSNVYKYLRLYCVSQKNHIYDKLDEREEKQAVSLQPAIK